MHRLPLVTLGVFLLMADLCGAATAEAAKRLLRVDPRGGADYRSIADAVLNAQPGDTIQLVAGSGPYREVLFIPQSGLEDAPIVFDGNGETITGFDPLKFVKEGDLWTCDLKPLFDKFKSVQQFTHILDQWVNEGGLPGIRSVPAFPSVLTYRGERLRQDPGTGQFLEYANLSTDGMKLTLRPGVSPDGWELASRSFAVRIYGAYYQTYRNLKASGSLNDGFNLHGAGQSLLFENIEGFNNIDEGFSAHDQINCEIRQGKFWGNDNGINNAPSSNLTASDLEIFSNLGRGFGLMGTSSAILNNVKIWDNGMEQFRLGAGARAECHDVLIYPPTWTTRQWLTTQESRKSIKPQVLNIEQSAQITGTPPQVLTGHQPPNSQSEGKNP